MSINLFHLSSCHSNPSHPHFSVITPFCAPLLFTTFSLTLLLSLYLSSPLCPFISHYLLSPHSLPLSPPVIPFSSHFISFLHPSHISLISFCLTISLPLSQSPTLSPPFLFLSQIHHTLSLPTTFYLCLSLLLSSIFFYITHFLLLSLPFFPFISYPTSTTHLSLSISISYYLSPLIHSSLPHFLCLPHSTLLSPPLIPVSLTAIEASSQSLSGPPYVGSRTRRSSAICRSPHWECSSAHTLVPPPLTHSPQLQSSNSPFRPALPSLLQTIDFLLK